MGILLPKYLFDQLDHQVWHQEYLTLQTKFLFFAYFEDEKKSIAKGENHVKSDHIECFMYNQGILRGKVHASMRSKVYEVTVRKLSCMFMFIFCESVGNH